MASAAYREWETLSVSRMDELERVHTDARGSGPGRRWGTDQLNRSLFVALLAQFQTYCRDLHDEAIDVHVANANGGQQKMIRALLSQGRKLDVGNPGPSALGSDFGRLGFDLLPLLKTTAAGKAAVDSLTVLVEFRNAASHGRESQVAALVAGGSIRPTLTSYRSYRKAITLLVQTLDRVTSDQLAALLSIPAPW